jgi:hypothetical protein
MKDLEEIVVEEETVEAAVARGLGILGSSAEDTQVIVEQPPRRWLLGLVRIPARVRLVRRTAPTRPGAAAIARTAAAPPPARAQRVPRPEGRDGTLEIREGRVLFTPPEGVGRLPVIRPGAHVVVLVNDEPVQGQRVIRATDRVEVRAMDDPPSLEPHVEITEGGLKACSPCGGSRGSVT